MSLNWSSSSARLRADGFDLAAMGEPMWPDHSGRSYVHEWRAGDAMFGGARRWRYRMDPDGGWLRRRDDDLGQDLQPRDVADATAHEDAHEDTAAYGSSYYTRKPPASSGRLRHRLLGWRDQHSLLGRWGAGAVLSAFWPDPDLSALRLLQKDAQQWARARVLDVGCGNGRLLRGLERCGVPLLHGVDPYASAAVSPGSIIRRPADSLHRLASDPSTADQRYDLIVFNHSLEHLADPGMALQLAHGRADPDARLLVRIPLIDSYAWQHYGVCWVQLDAPRHRCLPVSDALVDMALQAGWELQRSVRDSTAFQFWGSEMIAAGLTLFDPLRGGIRDPRRHFSRRQMWAFATQARRLNARELGDQGTFVFRRKARLHSMGGISLLRARIMAAELSVPLDAPDDPPTAA